MIALNDLTYRIGERLILDEASAALPGGARVGLVGRNGAGKTTLFRLILGEIGLDGGAISLPKLLRIGAVSQEAPGGPERLIDVVLAADTERAALIAERESAIHAEHVDGLRLADIETRLNDIGAHSAPSRAASILHGLGFDAAAQARPCSDFSGGWRMRVALAAVLFSEPDLLLLDEPTNYLDLEGTLWLYDYLARYPHTALIISHDRELLDECVDHILHLDRGKLKLYRGGYSSFARQLTEERELAVKHRAKQEAERAHLSAFIERFRAKASKARQAQSRVKRLEKMQLTEVRVDDDSRPILLESPLRKLSPPIIAMQGVSTGYGGEPILRRLDLSIDTDDRIALLGANGNGKSTFCKLIAGKLPATAGDLRRAPKLEVAFFAQHQLDDLRPDESAGQHVRRLLPDAPEAKWRSATARIGFPGPRADVAVERLSGGEKARLTLGLIGLTRPHLLILDEQTNHLDIDARAALVQALNDYEGAVIIVSHDRFLIEASADRLWLVNGGQVKPYDGDLDDYRKLVLSGESQPGERKTAPPPAPRPEPQPAPRAPAREIAKLRVAAEKRMEKLNSLIARIDAALADGEAFRTDAQKARELSRQRAELGLALSAAEEEWLALME
jgi:ATP-binding cassette subfamily F protein 3